MKYRYLDIAKGICMILVLMAHSCGFILFGEYLIAFYVPCFFVIAGYVYNDKYEPGEYIRKRARRILLPYFGYSLLLIFFSLILGWISNGKQIFDAVVGVLYSTFCLYSPVSREPNHLFYLVNNEPMWFLTAIFCASMIFYFTLRFCRNEKGRVALFFCYIWISKFATMLPIFLPWNLDRAFIGSSFMYIGYLCKKKELFTKKWIWGVVILTMPLYMLLVKMNPWINMSTSEYGRFPYINILIYTICGALGSVICIGIAKLLEKIFFGELFEIVGRNTIPILALHLILFRVIHKLEEHYAISFYERSTGLYYLWGYGKIFFVIAIILGIKYLFTICNRQYRKRCAKGIE